jgi:hypothetical protein
MPAHIIHAIYYTYNKAHTHMHAYRGQTHTRTSMTLTRIYTRIHAYTHVYTHTDDTESRGDPAKRGHSRHARHKFSKVISRVDWCGKYTRGLTLADCCRIAVHYGTDFGGLLPDCCRIAVCLYLVSMCHCCIMYLCRVSLAGNLARTGTQFWRRLVCVCVCVPSPTLSPTDPVPRAY